MIRKINTRLIVAFSFIALIAVGFSDIFASVPEITGSVGVGGHFTGIEDYYQRAGEFNIGSDDPYPEFNIDLSIRDGSRNYSLNGFYFDKETMFFKMKGLSSDLVKAEVSYRSFFRNRGNDQLENLLVRETTDPANNTPGGKMITSENTDPLAQYGYSRKEINSSLKTKIPLKESNFLELKAAHRSILEDGKEQKIASMHCSSCHIQAETVEVDRQTHSLSLEAHAKVDEVDLGYSIDYRHSKSDAAAPEVLYDLAQHPVNGGAIPEFGSRLSYDGEDVVYSRIPKTERLSHKLYLKTKIGIGLFSGAFSNSVYSNKYTGLETTANSGILNYVMKLSSRASLNSNILFSKSDSDPFDVDLAPWREGRAGGGQDFDYTRYSIDTRTRVKFDANLRYRPGNKTRMSILAGYDQITRDDYPVQDAENKTKKIFTQLKLKYKASKNLNLKLKYGLDMIDNPFTIYGQLLEEEGRGVISPLPGNTFAFYFQRDDLRYGDATNQPTQSHKIDAALDFKASKKIMLSVSGKITLDKNDDLVNYEFERTTIQPSASLTLVGGPRWSFFASGSYLLQTANAPLAVAMFDG